MHAGAGLEFPELLPRCGVERGEPPVVAADEQQSTASGKDPAVALLRPLITPCKLVRGHIERSNDAGAGSPGVRSRAAEVTGARTRRLCNRQARMMRRQTASAARGRTRWEASLLHPRFPAP